MSSKQIAFFIILVFIIAIPSVNAQEITIGEKADQKSIKVVINSANEIHVKHVIASLNSPKQIELINGTITNLTVSDEDGKKKQFGVIGDNDGIMIFPSQKNTIVEYDLGDVLFLKDNVWTWNFLYLETTSFIIPKEVDSIFVNNNPVYLDEKNGIACHGCQMILEYSIDEPKILKNVKLEDKEFLIEMRTFAEINQFNFDQSTKSISFEVNGKKQFVTTIIPLELLSNPYNVFMGDKKILFHQYNNGTHVWLNIRPDNSGNVSIIGTTVIDDEKLTIQNNPSTSESSVNQDIIVYILLGIIVLIGLVVIVIIMRKKRSSVTSREIQDDST
ncbi:hypothetical protein LBMAG54_02210 [Nitrosopumilaceae archaeon]|nr:hypothetical protein EMGBD3_07530 [Nitrosarchaeum sp.]GDY15365.1 hypothetical protein LBMAG54_02210 [Nitrosopumilaceae archaeon]